MPSTPPGSPNQSLPCSRQGQYHYPPGKPQRQAGKIPKGKIFKGFVSGDSGSSSIPSSYQTSFKSQKKTGGFGSTSARFVHENPASDDYAYSNSQYEDNEQDDGVHPPVRSHSHRGVGGLAAAAERFPSRPLPPAKQLPGPGEYQKSSDFDMVTRKFPSKEATPSSSFAGKPRHHTSYSVPSEEPGPGQYSPDIPPIIDPDVTSNPYLRKRYKQMNTNKSSAVFRSLASQRTDLKKDPTPGPGAYSPAHPTEYREDYQNKAAFAKGRRVIDMFDNKINTPGPADYFSAQDSREIKPTKPKYVSLAPPIKKNPATHNEKTPGPGSYNPYISPGPYSLLHQQPSASFSSGTSRGSIVKTDTPAPDSYKIKDHSIKKCFQKHDPSSWQ